MLAPFNSGHCWIACLSRNGIPAFTYHHNKQFCNAQPIDSRNGVVIFTKGRGMPLKMTSHFLPSITIWSHCSLVYFPLKLNELIKWCFAVLSLLEATIEYYGDGFSSSCELVRHLPIPVTLKVIFICWKRANIWSYYFCFEVFVDDFNSFLFWCDFFFFAFIYLCLSF